MNNKIKKALDQQFSNHRIVFWYDEKQEFEQLFAELELACVEKIKITNNEFQVKYRILRQEPDQKFLLYHAYRQLPEIDNWLLDVQLAEGVFKSDSVGIKLNEFQHNKSIQKAMEEKEFFLKSDKRISDLKQLVEANDTIKTIELKMLAVCANSNNDLESILGELITEYCNKRNVKLQLITKCNLESTLWELVQEGFNYKSGKPSLKDFLAELMDSSWKYYLADEITLHNSALAFLNNYKDNRNNRAVFITLATEFTNFYKIADKLHTVDVERIGSFDLYREVDKAVADYLIKSILQGTITQKDCAEIIKERELGFWYKEFISVYNAISYGAEFLEKLSKLDLHFSSMSEALRKYSTTWYELDQLYRRFSLALIETNHNTSLLPLAAKIENFYVNNFLLELNNSWQEKFDLQQKAEYLNQRDFFAEVVGKELKQHKVAVIISDALRYEVGQELLTRMKNENRYDGELSFMLGSLPSYTQLGMASLLPHKTLEFDPANPSTILVDGKSSVGLTNREKLLKIGEANSAAFNYNEINQKNSGELKNICDENRLLYIYHNAIDATGDKLITEEDLPEAVEKAITEITGLVKKIGGHNRISNFIITADHGFLYQNSKVEESDFVELDALEDAYKSRRFIIGKKLTQLSSLMKFTSEELNLGTGFELLIPKSINRFRVSGSGSKYVHGGASLQEMVIPLLKVSRNNRIDDVRDVEVDILSTGSNNITTSQITVKLYQKEAVTEKVQARTLSIALYSAADDLLSELKEITFDSDSELSREREFTFTLHLNKKAEDFNDTTIHLKLKEKRSGTTKFVDFKAYPYLLKRTFFSDF